MRFATVLVGLTLAAVAGRPVAAELYDRPSHVRTNYLLYCGGCHSPSGEGSPGMVPSFYDYMPEMSNDPQGREFLARVPGAATSPLSDQQLAEVMNWILEVVKARRPEVSYVPYTAEELGEWRKKPLHAIEPLRTELIARIMDEQPGD